MSEQVDVLPVATMEAVQGCRYLVYAGVTLIDHKERMHRGPQARRVAFAKFCNDANVQSAVQDAFEQGHIIVSTLIINDPIELARMIHCGHVDMIGRTSKLHPDNADA